MKKVIVLFTAVLFISGSALAEIVSVETARIVASNICLEKLALHPSIPGNQPVAITSVHAEARDGVPVYFVFSLDPAGFVIISAEDRIFPVIGYSFEHSFGMSNRPPNVQYWLDGYAKLVTYVREQNLKSSSETVKAWEHYIQKDFTQTRSSWGSVAPLLTTLWDQGWPYNYYCPEDPLGHGGHAWAGCVATAIAQIGYYNKWPDHGTGQHCYIPELHPDYGEQCADFTNTRYRFEEMTDVPRTVNKAIAEYQYHIGVAMEMNYDPNGSAPADDDSLAYFLRMLDYEWIYRDSIGDSAWVFLLKSLLDSGNPVFYSGAPETGAGHAWVCDGYQDSAYFHFNLGWGGQSNGYYYVQNIAGFDYNQSIVTPSYPDTINYSYPLFNPGPPVLTALEGSITDGSGPLHDYLPNLHYTWLIDPQTGTDSIRNIEISFVRFSTFDASDRLVIHDGESTESPVLIEVFGDTLPGKVTSSGNKVLIEFITDGINNGPGFYVTYYANDPVYCSGTTEISDTCAKFSDGSGSFHYQGMTTCKWRLTPEGCDTALTLHFSYFDTEEGKDFLTIYDFETQEQLAKYSGYYPDGPPPVTAQSGTMFILFTSNSDNNAQGWEAWYGNMLGIGYREAIKNIRVVPNPVSDHAQIQFHLASNAMVMLEVVDIYGKPVIQIDLGLQERGNHTYDLVSGNLATGNLASGIYICRITAGRETSVVKMVKW